MRALSIALVLLLVAPQAHGGPGQRLDRLRAAFDAERSPEIRVAHVGMIAKLGGRSAALTLVRILRKDPSQRVRVAAATGLGGMEADTATGLLVREIRQGGTRALRIALHEALAARRDGSRVLLQALATRSDLLGRVLLTHALGAHGDPLSGRMLVTMVRSKDPALASAARRTLTQRTKGIAGRDALLAKLIRDARTREALLPLLDGLDDQVTEGIAKALKTHLPSLEPEIAERAAALRVQWLAAQAMAESKAEAAAKPPAPAQEGRYAEPRSPPPDSEDEPPLPPTHEPPARFDLVYAIDATGSAGPNLPTIREHIRTEIDLLLGAGVSLRVGLVVYRGGHTGEREAHLDVLPLTSDVASILSHLDDLKASGVDERGAAVGVALRTALDRMPWRWRGSRVLQLFADGGIDDAPAALDVVGSHFRLDRTRTRVSYMLRTRTQVPQELAELARRGGAGAVKRWD